MSFRTVETTLSADLAASGTVTVSYPANTDEDSFAGHGHKAVAIGNVMSSPGDFTLTFGSASVTFTYGSGKTTIPAGSKLAVQMNLRGTDRDYEHAEDAALATPGVSAPVLRRVDLGSPLVADVDGVAASQDLPTGGAVTLVSSTVDLRSGAGGAPYGRALTYDSGEAVAGVVTVTGTDWQGNAMTETITLNGTTVVPGKKAFATVTAATVVGDSGAGFIIGFGDVLGLPFYLDSVDAVLLELEDNVAATAGTFVKGVDTVASATTGDVRGTYDPNSATDGAANFALYLAVNDPTYQGVTQA